MAKRINPPALVYSESTGSSITMKHSALFFTLSSLVVFFTGTSCNDSEKDPGQGSPTGKDGPVEKNKSSPAVPAQKKVFVLSDGSRIEFALGDGLRGRFSNFVGKFEIAEQSLVENGKNFISIDMSSIQTDDGAQTDQLKGDEILNVNRFPIARFHLKEAVPMEGNNYAITGILDLHGVAKEISFPATFSITGRETLMDLAAELDIKPGEFGISIPGSAQKGVILERISLNLKVNAMPGEPRELALGATPDATEPADERGQRRTDRGAGGQRRGSVDWRNMTEEERAERRRQFVAEIDKNKDGILAKSEMSERMWSFMGRADKNGDEMLSETEREEYRAERAAERELRELSGEGRDFGSGRGRGFRDGERTGSDRLQRPSSD